MVIEVRTVDEADREWLDMKIEMLGSGVDAAVDIAANWIEGRNVGRLYPGKSASSVIRERLGAFRFGKADIARLLAETPLSNRQIANVTGVSDMTVGRVARASGVAPDRPERLGADGKMYPAPVYDEPRPLVIDGEAEPVPIPDIYYRLLTALRAVDALRAEAMRDNAVFLLDVPDAERSRLTKVAQSVEKLVARLTEPSFRLS